MNLMLIDYFRIILLIVILIPAQRMHGQEADSLPKDWEISVGLGVDVAQLLQINPRVGAGENKFGLGWAVSCVANYHKDRLEWDNNLLWNFSIQKLGGGIFVNGDKKVPFQKSIDQLRLGSKIGFRFSDDSKFFYAVDFSFLSQVTRTYKGNYLKDIQEPEIFNDPISRILSPAQITFSIGIDYKPSGRFSLFYSPIGYKALVVASNTIADDVVRNGNGEITGSVHGNPIHTTSDKMELISFENVKHKMGSLLRANYNHKFLKNKISLKSNLVLYSNYLKNPERIDFEWTTETSFQVYKGLVISLLFNMFYDYDVFALRTNYDLPGGVEPVPERDLISYTEQFLIKYNINF